MAQDENLVKLTDSNFDQEVLKADKPVLVDFWAPWCGPCRTIGPVVENIAETFKDRVKVGKINIDDNPDTAKAYGVMSIPTIALFKGGNVVGTLIGLVPRERLEEMINKSL
jgi:thioredoxin 1